MSYILEALRKSDQQRQRGAMPTLQTAPMILAAPKRPFKIYYGLLAVVLLVAGIIIGWLRPWQAELPVPEKESVAAQAPISIPQQTAPVAPAPLDVPPEIPGKTVRELPLPDSKAIVQHVQRVAVMKPETAPASTGASNAAAPIPQMATPGMTASLGSVQEQRPILFEELPFQIQREIPELAVQLHAYSSIPGERLVSINSVRLREGGALTPGLTLEQITPEGMIFSYKGYRFQRGIR